MNVGSASFNFLFAALAATVEPAQTTPPVVDPGQQAAQVDTEAGADLTAPAPEVVRAPPDGLLPVGELTRLDFTPRDRPKALLYGTHLLVVAETGFVEGHDAANGEFTWKLGLPGEKLFDPVVFEAGPLVEGVTSSFTVVLSAPSGHILLLDGLTGDIRREIQLPFELALPPVRGPGDVVFLTTPSGDVVAYDVASENVVFQTATGETPLALASTDSVLIVSGGDRHVTAIDLPGGRVRWTFRGRAAFHAAAAFDAEGARVYIGDDTGEFYCLDAEEGAVQFRWSTGAAIRTAALVEGNRVYLASWANTLFAFNARSGDQHWRSNLPGRPATGPMRVRNRLLVATFDGMLAEYEPDRGQPGKRYAAPGEIVTPPSFFLAQPSPEELAELEAIETDDGAIEPEASELDADVFGPEDMLATGPADVAETPEDTDETDVEPTDADALPAGETSTGRLELPSEPMWFERSRIAMALRSGEVLLLAHDSPQTASPVPGDVPQALPGDVETVVPTRVP